MTEYRLAREVRLPKGTRLSQPVPPQREAVTYAHAVVDARLSDKFDEINAHFAIPLEDAKKAGLVEEVE